MYRDEQIASSLAKSLDEYDYAMIDTCSMMEEAFPTWLEIYEKSKKYALQFHPLIVLKQCFQELQKHAKGKDNDKKRAAKLALEILKTAKKNKTIAITKYKNRVKDSNFGDHAIFSKANDDHLDFRVLVITQDKKLTTDLLKLNEMSSQFGKPLTVMKISPKGELIRNKGVIDLSIKSKPTPTPISTKKEHPLVLSDRRLSAVIGNPNYPEERKLADVRAQLSALSKTDPKIKRSLDLNYSEDRLQAYLSSHAPRPLAKLTELKRMIVKKEEPKEPEQKPVATQKQETKPEPRPQSSVRTYQGQGRDLMHAFTQAALLAGIIVRDQGVPYIPAVHGRSDITNKELKNFLQKAEKDGKKPTIFKNLNVEFGTESDRFVITLSYPEAPRPEVKKVVEEAPKKVKPKPSTVAPSVKVEPKKEAPKPSAPVKEDKPKAEKASKVAPKAKTNDKPVQAKVEEKAAEPKKPTLIVAVPDDPKVAEAIERKVSHVRPKAETSPKAKSAAKESKKAEPKAKPTKKAEPKKEDAKPTEKKAEPAPQPNSSPAKAKKAPAKKAEDKPKEAAAPKVAPKHPHLLAQAKTAEARLMAVLPNSTYSSENKAKDIQTHLALIAKLSKAERAELKLSAESLKKSLSDLQKPKKD